MAFLSASNISLSYADNIILNNVTLTISTGDRIALTGQNGSGKTTLLKIAAGITAPDNGSVAIANDHRVSYLPQSGIFHEGRSLYEEAEKAFDHMHMLEARMHQTGDILKQQSEKGHDTTDSMHEHAAIQEKLLGTGFYERHIRIDQVLTGLGFSRNDFKKNTGAFSGGWQMRIALAKLLLESPDFMLLDEPTNYLDLETIQWLERFFRNYSGGVLIVSHDRHFLDRTVTRIAELFNKKITVYHGSYSAYEKKRAGELESLVQRYYKQQEDIERLENFIARFRKNASKASQVQSRVKELEKIERIELPPSVKRIHFDFPPPPHSGKTVLDVQGISKAWGSHNVFNNVDFKIERGEKVVILGKNGAGKTSLLRIISGSDDDYKGTFSYGKDVSAGYFSQHYIDSLNDSNTIMEEITETAPTSLVPRIRGLLGAFLFSGDDIFKHIGVLSGGEKNRISLLKLLLHPVNLLILDEPTNHLDIHSKDVLLDRLRSFDGTIVFVSHDRYFIRGLATKVIEIKGGKSRYFHGDYDYYRYRISGEDEPAPEKQNSEDSRKTPSKVQLDRKEQKARQARIRKLQRTEEQLLEKVEKMDERKKLIQSQMSSPEVYINGQKVKTLAEELELLSKEEEEKTEEWHAISEELEGLLEKESIIKE